MVNLVSKKTLEKIVSPVRLGWHGVLFGVASGTMIYFSDNKLVDNIGPSILGVALACYTDSLTAFIRTRRNINNYGNLDERLVKPHMKWYCNRQGARTAAANAGMAEDFDRIMNSYDKKMILTSIPHI